MSQGQFHLRQPKIFPQAIKNIYQEGVYAPREAVQCQTLSWVVLSQAFKIGYDGILWPRCLPDIPSISKLQNRPNRVLVTKEGSLLLMTFRVLTSKPGNSGLYAVVSIALLGRVHNQIRTISETGYLAMRDDLELGNYKRTKCLLLHLFMT